MTAPSHDRPNILLIMADQMSAPFLPCYGGRVATTPAIDHLAADGVVFERAYSNSPLCAPARYVTMTGQRNSRIGAYDNASELPATVPTFVHHLRRGGYQTSLIGKMHFVGPDQLHGYEERLTTDIYPADFGWTPNWDEPDGRFDRWYHNLDSVVNAGVADASNQLDYDDDVGHLAVRKLRDLARTADRRPWFLTVSFSHPHDPYVARQEYWDRYDHDRIDLPSVGPLDPASLDPHSARLRRAFSPGGTAVTEAQTRNARHAYYANCSYVDDWVGRLLATLEHHGMADDTAIVFTADHGDMLGERGLWYKMTFFEHGARVPLIIRRPGGPSGRVATLASLLDIAPTVLDLAGFDLAGLAPAGVDLSDAFDGSSLLPLIETERPERTIVGEYLGEGALAPVFMLRRGRWKFIWSRPDPAQLFDLTADPCELDDLAAEPERAELVEALTAEIGERWDAEAIEADVLASQRSRRVVDAALRRGRYQPWDWQPVGQAAELYMRNHLDLNEVEASRRSH